MYNRKNHTKMCDFFCILNAKMLALLIKMILTALFIRIRNTQTAQENCLEIILYILLIKPLKIPKGIYKTTVLCYNN